MSKQVWLTEKRRGARVTALEEDAVEMVRYGTHEYEDDNDCPAELKNGKGRVAPENVPSTEVAPSTSSFTSAPSDSAHE